MGWFIAFLLIFLLAILPLGASVKYNSEGVLVRIIAGPVRFTVVPAKKKEKKPKEKKKKKEKSKKETEKSKTSPDKKGKKKEKGGSLTDFLPLVQAILDLLADFGRKLRLILAGDDPCDLGINYGRAWEAVGNLVPLLERAFVIKKKDIEVECDFTASETLIIARLDLTITLGRIIALAVVRGIPALREYLRIKNKRKGGAVK